jgi:hypothetical protein
LFEYWFLWYLFVQPTIYSSLVKILDVYYFIYQFMIFLYLNSTGTCKMRNETRNEICETEQNETKRNLPKTKRNETERNGTKRNETERNKMKRNLSKWNETKRNYTMFISDIHWGVSKMGQSRSKCLSQLKNQI